MANINKKPDHTARLGRHGHDLGQTLKFTSSVGHLLPVYYDVLNPNERVRCEASIVSRTVRPMKSPAFTILEEHLDWFFVPMSVMYTLFEQTYYRINDIHSSIYQENDVSANELPTFSLQSLITTFDSASNTQSFPSSQAPNNNRDAFGVPVVQNAQRLAELLGYSSKPWDEASVTSADFVSSNAGQIHLPAWLLGAYQAIFYSYYRLTDWTSNDPEAYNFDQFYSTRSLDTIVDKLFTIHYRPYKKDLFTNTYPSPLITQNNIGMLHNYSGFDEDTVQDYKGYTSYNGGPDNVQAAAAPDTSSVRGMFALEKLMEITRRAGKHVDDQTLAHFGIKPSARQAGEVIYLGSQHGVIGVNQVLATSAGQNGDNTSSLGELAGYAFGQMEGKPIEFTATEHGVLMCIYSCVPEADYSAAQSFDKLNTLSKVDRFYFPEFDNMGMNPQFYYQANFEPWRNLSSFNNRIQGWQYRYYEYKQKYNRTAGGFAHSLSYWTTQRNIDMAMMNDMEKFMYCSPTILNQVLVFGFPYLASSEHEHRKDKAASTYVGNFSLYDPFAHMAVFDVKKTSTMSTYSLPSL